MDDRSEYTPFGWIEYNKINVGNQLKDPRKVDFSNIQSGGKRKKYKNIKGGGCDCYNIQNMLFGFEYETIVQIVIDHESNDTKNAMPIINFLNWIKTETKLKLNNKNVINRFLIASIISANTQIPMDVATKYHGSAYKTYDYMDVDGNNEKQKWTITKDGTVY